MFLAPRTLVDAGTAEWVIDRTSWLISALGPTNFYRHTRLVLPSARFFPPGAEPDELFDALRAHMGIAHWPCRLVPRFVAGDRPMPADAVAGTYMAQRGEAVITYDPRLARRRNALIGTMAHELAHYILDRTVPGADGDELEHERLTDLTVVVAGLGLIDILGAREMGWRGYLDLDARIFALAVVLRLKRLDLSVAETYLEPALIRKLRRAARQLEGFSDEVGYMGALRPHGA